MDGIFNIHKVVDMTSHDVVAKIRKLLKQRRVGHAGTLDPAASGVLPICVGQGTRVAEYLSESGKAYQAEVMLGVVTDTYDREGAVLRTASIEGIELPQIQKAVEGFVGPQMQLPPHYSAIKLHGQPAYKLARAGKEVLLEPRPIVIYEMTIAEWSPPKLILAIECSKGTYIRSLAYDLGEQLGCGAYLSGLVRTRSGPFLLAESVSLAQLAEIADSGTLANYLYAADKALEQYPALVLDVETAERVAHGNEFKYEPSEAGTTLQVEKKEATHVQSLARVYDANGRFLAIAQWDAEQEHWRPKKVFVA